MRLVKLACAIIIGIASAGATAPPERYALLVGVSAYPGEKADGSGIALNGPRNDAALMYKTLIKSGIPAANIRVVADTLVQSFYPGVRADAEPTHDNIVAGLNWLESKARPGTEITIFMAGHGAYKPEPKKASLVKEEDGKDELFLPIDIGRWIKDDEAVDRELSDDSIGASVGSMISKGAFVWMIVDACHSGTLVRNDDPSGYTSRALEPKDLGIPSTAAAGATRTTGGRPDVSLISRKDEQSGQFVAFYAAQPEEKAYERLFPLDGPPAQKRPHGVLSWAVANTLNSGRFASFRDMAVQVRSWYAPLGNSVSRPLFNGDLFMRSSLFAGREGSVSMRTGNDGWFVRMGTLDGAGVGSLFAIRDARSSDYAKPLAFARVTRSEPGRAAIAIIEDDPRYPNGLPEFLRANSIAQASQQEEVEKWVMATPVQLVEPTPLLVARPASWPAALPVDLALPAGMAWQQTGRPANLHLIVDNDRLWFVQGGATWQTAGPDQPLSFPLNSLSGETVGQALIMQQRGLRLAASAGAQGQTALAAKFVLTVSVKGGRRTIDDKCERTAAPERLLPKGQPMPIFADCDRVTVRFDNRSDTMVDLTPLEIDRRANIDFLLAGGQTVADDLRVAPGSSITITRLIGSESQMLYLLATRSELGQSFLTSFRHLQGESAPGNVRPTAVSAAQVRPALPAPPSTNRYTPAATAAILTLPLRSQGRPAVS